MFNNKYSIIKLVIKKKISFLVLLLNLFMSSGIYSQNLVPNGSFESIKKCNYVFGQLDTVMNNWTDTKYGAAGTVDTYNKCYFHPLYPSTSLSIPLNISGFQYPKSGNGYTGLYTGLRPASVMNRPDTISSAYSEVMGVKLNQPLNYGNQYKVRLYVSLVDSCLFGGDGLGIYISSDTMIPNPYTYANINAQIRQNGHGAIIDTTNWTAITDTFTANGGEQYIFIGSFTADSAINKLHNSGYPGPVPQFSPPFILDFIYYYVDDLAIWRADSIPPTSNAGADTTICLGGKAILGKHNYGDYYYEWFTKDSVFNNYSGLLQNGFMKYSNCLSLIGDSGFISVSPNKTTTYYCLATDFTFEKTLDSVTVYVVDCGQNDTTVCIEQTFIMGNTNNPNWNYKWSPPTFLNYDTIGQPQCSPTNDITYYLLITNSNNDTVSLDTVNIFVVNCYSAEAGLDTTLCLGDSIQIGSHNHSSCTYVWWPNQWLSDSTTGMPFAKPDTLIKYFLQVIDTLGNISVDSILIGIIDCDTVGIDASTPLSVRRIRVYPNPASGLIIIEFEEILHQEGVIEIYDNIGRKVMETVLKQGENKYQITTKKLESGIYFYKLQAAQSYNGKIIISK